MNIDRIFDLNLDLNTQSYCIKETTMKAEKRIKKTLKRIEELEEACGVETDKKIVKQLTKIAESLKLVHGLINTVIDDSEEITNEIEK